MSKNSTLIYFVNNFKTDFSSVISEDTVEFEENFLTEMDVAENAPSEQIINKILNFARSYEVFETEEVGYVEMNLN